MMAELGTPMALAWKDTPMGYEDRLDAEQLRQAIAALEAQQQALKLDFTAQIAELQQRLEDAPQTLQSGAGAIATTGGVAAGGGSIAAAGEALDSAVLPYLAEYIGQVVGIGFEPGKSEVRIKTDTTTVTVDATADQANKALELRHSSVRVVAVIQGKTARLLMLQDAHAPINRATREAAIFARWDGVLRKLAQ
jgi:hypothetical protein